MTDLKSLLAERRAKAMGKPLDYFDDQALLAYVDLLEKVIERQNETLDRIVGMCAVSPRCACGRSKGFLAVTFCGKNAQAEVRRMLTEEIK